MHEYQFSPDLVRFAFVLGVIASVMIYDRLRMTTGSLVVPGYLGVFILQPAVILVTLANALIGWALIYRLLPRYAVVYGRTRFLLVSAVSVGLQVLLLQLGRQFELGFGGGGPLVGIGFVIPALLANDFGRQGIRKTVLGAGAGGGLVGAVVLLALWLVPGLRESGAPVDYGRLAFNVEWLPFAVLASAVAAVGLQAGFSFRSGGMIGAGYLALVFPGWQEIAVIAVGSVVTYAIVTLLIQRRTVLFGRRKFAAMLIVGSLVSWLAYPLAAQVAWLEVDAFATLPLTGAILTGLFANDMERAGLRKVGAGTVLSLAIALSATLLTREVVTGGDGETIVALVALAAGVLSLAFLGAGIRELMARRGTAANAPLRAA